MKVLCVLTGGPMRKIMVSGEVIEFEDHPYCGPTILHKRTGSPRKFQPIEFLEAATRWAQQGRKIENGLCVWK